MSRAANEDVGARATALEQAIDAGGHRLDEAAVRRSRALLAKLGERQRL